MHIHIYIYTYKENNSVYIYIYIYIYIYLYNKITIIYIIEGQTLFPFSIFHHKPIVGCHMFCLFCTMNCYFEYRIRILCICLYIGTYFKCIVGMFPSSSSSSSVRPVVVRPVGRPVVRPAVRPVPSSVVRRRRRCRRRCRRPSSVVVVRRRLSKYYLQDCVLVLACWRWFQTCKLRAMCRDCKYFFNVCAMGFTLHTLHIVGLMLC